MKLYRIHKAGILLAYLWAATWIIGPLAASWPHVFLGFMVCLPGTAALVIVHALREFPVSLGVLLLAVGVAVAVLAESRYLIIVLGAAAAVVSGALMIFSRFISLGMRSRDNDEL